MTIDCVGLSLLRLFEIFSLKINICVCPKNRIVLKYYDNNLILIIVSVLTIKTINRSSTKLFALVYKYLPSFDF